MCYSWHFLRTWHESNTMTHELVFAQSLLDALRQVNGIDGVVLGGSRARGLHSPDSDVDIGIYYGASAPLDLDALNRVAQQFDDAHATSLVAAPGGWGPWVNGGAWMTIAGIHVDFILRDTLRVATVITDCENGHVSAHYQPGHPHAYINAMYMGELAVSQLWWDAHGVLAPLKARAMHYPVALQQAIFAVFGFEMTFSLDLAIKTSQRHDDYYVMAHIVRSMSCLNQVLFAVNRQYCINEKRAVAIIDTMPMTPPQYAQRITQIFAQATQSPHQACALLGNLIAEAQSLMHAVRES